jgi:hypothetical protein
MPLRKSYKRRKSRNKRRRKGFKRTRKAYHVGGSDPHSDTKVFHFFNSHHLGDNIFNLKFFFDISDIMKQNGISIKYYYNNTYVNNNREELERFINNDTMSLHVFTDKPANAVELWMGNMIEGIHHHNFDTYYNAFYTNILKLIGLDGKDIDTSLYQPEPYLQDIYNDINKKFNDKYKDLDILIINSFPNSGQIIYDKKKFDDMCIMLNKKYKIVTTTHVNGDIKCTGDDKLKLQDIGSISTHVKYIIGVHSGPIVPCYNKDTKNSVKKWILFLDGKLDHKEINVVRLKSQYDFMKVEEHLT